MSISLTVDGIPVTVEEGATVAEAACPIASISCALPNGYGKASSAFSACRSAGARFCASSSAAVTTKPPPTE